MLFGAAGTGAQNQAETAMLSLASGSSAEGHITLSWQLPSGLAEGVLQIAASHAFDAADSAFVELPISSSGTLVHTGLADGRYFFRAGVPGRWSAVQQLQVRHHALSTAFFYFSLGLAVFIALAGVILHGSLRRDGPDA